MYMKGMEVEAIPGSVILADIIDSYFNRTYRHFSSHRQTPSSGKAGNPAVVQNGNVIYFSSPVFSQYYQNAPRWCKVMVLNALESLLPEPLIRLEAPSATIAAVNEQSVERRWVVHLLHYVPERRGQEFDIIEDVIPIYDVKVSVRIPEKVKRVEKVPHKKSVKFKTNGDRVDFMLDVLDGHQMLALSY